MDAISTPKLWGETRLLVQSSDLILRHASVEACGYCSVHLHSRMDNVFYVMSGILVVEVYRGPKPLSYRLKLGKPFGVRAGVPHRFFAATQVELLEWYVPNKDYCDPLDEADIFRWSEGGIGLLPKIDIGD